MRAVGRRRRPDGTYATPEDARADRAARSPQAQAKESTARMEAGGFQVTETVVWKGGRPIVFKPEALRSGEEPEAESER